MNKLRLALAAPLLALGFVAGSAAVQPAAAMSVLSAGTVQSTGEVTLVPMYDMHGNIVGYLVVRKNTNTAS